MADNINNTDILSELQGVPPEQFAEQLDDYLAECNFSFGYDENLDELMYCRLGEKAHHNIVAGDGAVLARSHSDKLTTLLRLDQSDETESQLGAGESLPSPQEWLDGHSQGQKSVADMIFNHKGRRDEELRRYALCRDGKIQSILTYNTKTGEGTIEDIFKGKVRKMSFSSENGNLVSAEWFRMAQSQFLSESNLTAAQQIKDCLTQYRTYFTGIHKSDKCLAGTHFVSGKIIENLNLIGSFRERPGYKIDGVKLEIGKSADGFHLMCDGMPFEKFQDLLAKQGKYVSKSVHGGENPQLIYKQPTPLYAFLGGPKIFPGPGPVGPNYKSAVGVLIDVAKKGTDKVLKLVSPTYRRMSKAMEITTKIKY